MDPKEQVPDEDAEEASTIAEDATLSEAEPPDLDTDDEEGEGDQVRGGFIF